mmetsp:Transcript_10653/g.21881  ORF Transcript_10653/g.21881 Transcript_10653/m.21881 type:complete len:366 (-) Transcript_10653:1438-2535(-)
MDERAIAARRHGRATEQEGDVVAIGLIACAKSDEIRLKVDEFQQGLGFVKYSMLMSFLHVDQYRGACVEWGIMERVGENFCFGIGDNAVAVPILIDFVVRSKAELENEAFVAPLKAICDESIKSENPKAYYLVGKPKEIGHEDDGDPFSDNEAEEEVMNSENTYVLWLHPKFFSEHSRLLGHFSGEGESMDIKNRISYGNTDSGNILVEICESNWKYIKSRSSKMWSKLCSVLAITVVVSERSFWMEDNEHPELVQKFVQELAAYWRTNLLRKTDAHLGIGLDGEIVPADEMSESRKAIYQILKGAQDCFESIEDQGRGKLRFNWKPSATTPRKRKAPSPTTNAVSVLAPPSVSFDETSTEIPST